MEIKLQGFNCVYLLTFGYKKDWFAQANFITLVKEYYYNYNVEWADMVFKMF